jgi:hypothetical protein
MASDLSFDPGLLVRKFERIGARLSVDLTPRPIRLDEQPFVLDVRNDARGEFFQLVLRRPEGLVAAAIDVRVEDRHLLLLVKDLSAKGDLAKQRFLCGHDERHWFVAAVPEVDSAKDIGQAKEALKPASVRTAQAVRHLGAGERNRRRNAAFVRQGEWFFLPAPDAVVDERMVLRNEPLQRGGGKPHIAQELHRSGGEEVYVARGHPQPVTEARYRALLNRHPSLRKLAWTKMRRNTQVLVRGRISHPDHKTVVLRGWHRVQVNTEHRSRAMRNVAFLD